MGASPNLTTGGRRRRPVVVACLRRHPLRKRLATPRWGFARIPRAKRVARHQGSRSPNVTDDARRQQNWMGCALYAEDYIESRGAVTFPTKPNNGIQAHPPHALMEPSRKTCRTSNWPDTLVASARQSNPTDVGPKPLGGPHRIRATSNQGRWQRPAQRGQARHHTDFRPIRTTWARPDRRTASRLRRPIGSAWGGLSHRNVILDPEDRRDFGAVWLLDWECARWANQLLSGPGLSLLGGCKSPDPTPRQPTRRTWALLPWRPAFDTGQMLER